MSKKQKRQVSFTTPSAPSTPSTGKAAVSTVRPGSEFNPDYTYIKKDLRSLGFMVAGFLVVLIVLSFFLR
jgi:hypothetical protein